MIDLDIKYAGDKSAESDESAETVEIAGDEYALQELCAALKLCANNGFDVELTAKTNTSAAANTKYLFGISIEINDSQNCISVSKNTLIVEGDEDFLLHLRSSIPWDVEDIYSGLSHQVHFDRASFGDYLDGQSIDVILTKKRCG